MSEIGSERFTIQVNHNKILDKLYPNTKSIFNLKKTNIYYRHFLSESKYFDENTFGPKRQKKLIFKFVKEFTKVFAKNNCTLEHLNECMNIIQLNVEDSREIRCWKFYDDLLDKRIKNLHKVYKKYILKRMNKYTRRFDYAGVILEYFNSVVTDIIFNVIEFKNLSPLKFLEEEWVKVGSYSNLYQNLRNHYIFYVNDGICTDHYYNLIGLKYNLYSRDINGNKGPRIIKSGYYYIKFEDSDGKLRLMDFRLRFLKSTSYSPKTVYVDCYEDDDGNYRAFDSKKLIDDINKAGYYFSKEELWR